MPSPIIVKEPVEVDSRNRAIRDFQEIASAEISKNVQNGYDVAGVTLCGHREYPLRDREKPRKNLEFSINV